MNHVEAPGGFRLDIVKTANPLIPPSRVTFNLVRSFRRSVFRGRERRPCGALSLAPYLS